jgi:hypothetical protein
MANTKTYETIRALVAEIAPEYSFIFANVNMANVRADDAQFPLAYLEEMTGATYAVDQYGRVRKFAPIEIYFLRRAPMQGEAVGRDEIRAQIEAEVVHPLIATLANRYPTISNISADYPPALFDDNDVGICLRFQIEVEGGIC